MFVICPWGRVLGDSIMKKFIIFAALALPSVAHAESLDVISSRIKDGCSVAKYIEITKDFNETWGKANGYTARIITPVQSSDTSMVGWVGTTANAQAFGKAWDTWLTALSNPNSVPAKLQARFDACTVQISRTSYTGY